MDSVLYAFLWFAIALIAVTTMMFAGGWVLAGCTSNYLGIRCRTYEGRMVVMKMDRDIKSIGYGVKVGKNYVSSENVKTMFFGKIKTGTYLTKTGVMLFSNFDDAKETAEEVNGKVIELYAREVSEDED